jgi:tetratricopeptide (TPR) repeat protein
MSDSPRTDRARSIDVRPDIDREAKIEQLLLDGLDHYFAARYDQAINVWTRALFLDRNHPRARAYIERARSALAERQRESEELLQRGVAAFERGDVDEARELLQGVIARGGPSVEALALIDRLNRLDTIASLPSTSPEKDAVDTVERHAGEPSRRSTLIIAMGLAAVVLMLAGLVTIGRDAQDWRRLLMLDAAPNSATAAPISGEPNPPLPRRSEAALGRAEGLAAAGHLHDALAALDLVRPTDPEKAAADRLRTDIQRELRALASPSASAAPEKGSPPPR